jgi:ADP-heptose:LPS heptosyltransferase
LKILVVQFRSLGDAVVSIPVLMAIRDRFPGCELHSLVMEAAAPLLRHHPVLDKVWSMPRVRGKARLVQSWPIIKALRAEKFDLSVDIGNNDRSALTSFACGARERRGVLGRKGFLGKRFCFTHTVRPAPLEMHESLRLLDILSPLGIRPPSKIELKLYLDPALPNPFPRTSDVPRVICNTGAGCSKKCWPAGHWARLHRLAAASRCEMLFLSGTHPREVQLARELQGLSPDIKFLPPMDLARLMVVLNSADVMISNDTGPMHFAAGLGVKTIAMFGPTSAQRWSPIGPEVRILKTQSCSCPTWTHDCLHSAHCMFEITPEAVFQHLEAMLPVSA